MTDANSFPHKGCRTPGECQREQVCLDAWACSCHPENWRNDPLENTPIVRRNADATKPSITGA